MLPLPLIIFPFHLPLLHPHSLPSPSARPPPIPLSANASQPQQRRRGRGGSVLSLSVYLSHYCSFSSPSPSAPSPLPSISPFSPLPSLFSPSPTPLLPSLTTPLPWGEGGLRVGGGLIISLFQPHPLPFPFILHLLHPDGSNISCVDRTDTVGHEMNRTWLGRSHFPSTVALWIIQCIWVLPFCKDSIQGDGIVLDTRPMGPIFLVWIGHCGSWNVPFVIGTQPFSWYSSSLNHAWNMIPAFG